jgi:hypothetical protein
MRRLAAGFVLLAFIASVPHVASGQPSGVAVAAADPDPVAIGRRIYLEGMLPSGLPLQGAGPANVVLAGSDAACATCHRRSGYGSSEGPVEVRSITGAALFGNRVAPVPPGGATAPVAVSDGAGLSAAEVARSRANVLRAARATAFAGSRPRPTYDDASLTRAIREGVDVTGRAMNASMPRFALEPAALAALTAYLKTLSVQTAPGVTDDKVHFATVIQPGTDPAQRQALLDVLQAFMKDRNLGLRDQVAREQGGNTRLGRAYREWVLHVWDLSGPSEAWGRQLEARYQAQPVFAMVSGLGQASWRPIHEFSERLEVPCIFPQVDLPALAERDFYTVYLSRGITLEAQALAQFLKGEGRGEGTGGPVAQVFRRDGASAAGAEAFRQAMRAGGGAAPVDIVLDGTPDQAYWRQLARQTAGATLVLWLPPGDLARAQALADAGPSAKALYLSSSLNAAPRSGLAADGTGGVRLVYPQDLPATRDGRLEVVRRWLRNNGIALTDEKVQMNAYLAATVTGMLVTHSRDTYSREFLLERMEHRLGTAIELSIYPTLSLGPGQRYASKGSYIVEVRGEDDRQLKAVSDWIVP